ncbi:MAG: hypothetical protein NHB32_14275 [Fischerella sp. CENA71]|nr:hypothetical protein [Fischerella sp. CENA71]
MARTKKLTPDESQVVEDTTINDSQQEQAAALKSRKVLPKKVITLILDAARSSTKFLVIDDEGQVIECPKLPSVFAELQNPLHQELGAYTVGLKLDASKGKPDEKPTEEIKHYVVGERALLEETSTAMTDSHDNKLNYFYLLALGAITAIPDLHELSTGASEKSRTLTLKMVVLSLADGKTLLDQLKKCRWIKVNGVKYRLNFLFNQSLYFAEGYGSAVWAKSELVEHQDITIFDVGFGTACQTSYLCTGKLPLKRTVETNGGGGLGSLVEFLAKAMAMGDSSRLIPISEVRQILEDSQIKDGKILATANDGRDVSGALERAIHWWMTESTLKFALDAVCLKARRHPVVLVGGSFAIPPILERIKKRLIDGGANKELIKEVPNPGMLSIEGMQELFVEQKQPHLQVVKNAEQQQKEDKLHSPDSVINPDTNTDQPIGDNSNILDSQSA